MIICKKYCKNYHHGTKEYDNIKRFAFNISYEININDKKIKYYDKYLNLIANFISYIDNSYFTNNYNGITLLSSSLNGTLDIIDSFFMNNNNLNTLIDIDTILVINNTATKL